MSGIGGIFHRTAKPILASQLTAIASTLSHRGPDGISYFNSANIGFFHCALHDTPESLFEKLPASNHAKNLILTWQGRIDNREELRDKTGWQRPLSQTTDSDLILAAYEKWDRDCIHHFLGDFAFALWNSCTQTLFCARDHMGVEPFFYVLTNKLFAFSSEIKGLLTLPIDTGGINKNRIADYLTSVVTENENTFYNHIFRLPPGNYLEVTNNSSHQSKYWEPHSATIACSNNLEFEEQFYSIFKKATRCRLRSAFPIGSFLSGGLDSSSIVCMAAGPLQHKYPGNLHTLSGVFNKIQKCDERHFFQSVLDRYHTTPHYVQADKLNPGNAYDQIMATEDEPFWAPHFFMKWELLALARRQKIRVVLDGHDGDSAVSLGGGLFPELFIQGKWFRLLQECHALGHSPTFIKTIRTFLRVCFQRIRYKTMHILPTHCSGKNVSEMLSRLNPSFVSDNNIKARLARLETIQPNPGQTDYTHHQLSLKHPLQPLLLEFFDRQHAQSGLVGRYPFFDKRLIEFCLALPTDQKRNMGFNRNIMRKSLRNIQPRTITDRKTKTSFMPNLTHSFSSSAQHWLRFNIDNLSKETYTYINRGRLQQSYKSFVENPPQVSLGDLGFLLRVVSLNSWLKNN